MVYQATDNCCRKRCYPHKPCGNLHKGCETDNDCLSGLRCTDKICTDIDECAENPDLCGVSAICSNNIRSYSCTCQPGYGNLVVNVGCSDLDECALTTHRCSLKKVSTQAAAICSNTIGNYTCTCPPGFAGDPYVACNDINECLITCNSIEGAIQYGITGATNFLCYNYVGYYRCYYYKYPPGYILVHNGP